MSVVEAKGLPHDVTELRDLLAWHPKLKPVKVDRHAEKLSSPRRLQTGLRGDEEAQADQKVHRYLRLTYTLFAAWG